MIKKLALAAALVFTPVASLAPVSAFEPNCNFYWQVKSINSMREVDNGRISVRSGKSCITRHVGRVNGVWTYHGLEIARQPKHAKISKVGRVGIKVKADERFSGKDSAEIVLSFRHSRTNRIVKTLVRTRLSIR